MIKLLFTLVALSLITEYAYSQSEGGAENKKNKKADRGATYGENFKVSGAKNSKAKKYDNQDYDAKIKEFQERMQANARKQKKMAREMEKPQYSDPTYFGHKKKPKKRKNGKKKYCKECDLVH